MMKLPGDVIAVLSGFSESDYLPFVSDAERLFSSILDSDDIKGDAIEHLIEIGKVIDQVISDGRYHFSEYEFSLLSRGALLSSLQIVDSILNDPEFEPDLTGVETFNGDRSLQDILAEFHAYLDALKDVIPVFDSLSLAQWQRYWTPDEVENAADDAPVIFRADDLSDVISLTPIDFGLVATLDKSGRLVRLEHYENGSPSPEYLEIDPDRQSAREVSGILPESDTAEPSISPADYAVYYYDWIAERLARFSKRYQNRMLECDFCGKSQQEVLKLIAGPKSYICDECVSLCNDIIAEEMDGVH